MNVEDLADKLLNTTKDRLGEAWDSDLGVEARDRIAEASFDLAELTTRALLGDDVSADQAHLKAQIANWSFVGSSLAAKAFKAAVEDVGVFLVGLLKGVL